MRKNVKHSGSGYLSGSAYRRRWKWLTSILSVFVIIGTISGLVMPAITLNQIICGKEEHKHQPTCYSTSTRVGLTCDYASLGVHQHGETCVDAEGNLTCTLPDFAVHIHDSLCLDENGVLICTLKEIADHQHDDSCYQTPEPVVQEGHIHSDSCYAWSTPETPACGLEASEEHPHSEDCYVPVRGERICGLEEQEPSVTTFAPEQICGKEELSGWEGLVRHQHSEDCYAEIVTETLICPLEEHTHTDACRTDLTADTETQEDWEATLPEELVSDFAEDLLLVARSQVGYQQSQENYMLAEDGTECHYNRYGAWYGEPYGDWQTLFMTFCLHYARIPQEAVPYGSDLEAWYQLLVQEQYLTSPEAVQPRLGDLVFLDLDEDQLPDTLGILDQVPLEEPLPTGEETETEGFKLVTIQGDVEGCVAQVDYDSTQLLSFLSMEHVKLRYGQWLLENPPQESVPETTEAAEPGETTAPAETTDSTETTGETAPIEDTGAALGQTHTLVHQGEDYTLTVTYGDEARLPKDVTLRVEELLPGSAEYEDYYTQVKAALGTDQILYTRLFDVTFLVEGKEIEPAAAVDMSIQYHTPLEVEASAVAEAQVVHFGDSGTEVIPAEITENASGITEITHSQDSFSVVAYNLIVNVDTGEDKLLIDWYVYLDRVWTKVGSTRTGWQAVAGGSKYDYISESQALSILKPYGFGGGATGWHDLAYQKISSYGENPVLERGIYSVTGHTDGYGRNYYQLSTDASTDAYAMYYIPNTGDQAFADTTGSNNTLQSMFGDVINVYSVQVYDPNNTAYDPEETRPTAYATHGQELTMTINMPTDTTDLDDSWCLYRTSLVYVGELDTTGTHTEGDLGHISFVDAGNSQVNITIHRVTQTMYIGRQGAYDESSVDTKIPPDSLTVNYYVYLQGEWRHIGTTHTGWTIDDRLASTETGNKGPYLDPNYTSTAATGGYMKAEDGKFYYARDLIRMSQVSDMFGKYGYTPEYKNQATAGDKSRRITNIGYQKIEWNADKTATTVGDTVFFDTYYDYKQVDLYPLSQAGTRITNNDNTETPRSCAGYNLYYVPDGSASSSVTAGPEDPTLTAAATLVEANIPVYVHLDGAWTKVGIVKYMNAGESNDRVSLAQLEMVLSPYGFKAEEMAANPGRAAELFSLRSKTYTNYTEYDTTAGTWMKLGTAGTAGYAIYWMPGTTAKYTNANSIPLVDGGSFYLFSVFEPSHSVYESQDVTPKVYVRQGQTGTLEVLKPPAPAEGQEPLDWSVKGLDRNTTLMASGLDSATVTNADGSTSTISRVLDKTTGLYTYTFTNMRQTAIVAFPFTNGDRSLSNNYANADVVTALDDVIADPNIQFTMHNYSTKINDYITSLGLAHYTKDYNISNGEVYLNQDSDKKNVYFSFRGAGGDGLHYAPLLDNDPFYRNHSTVKRNLDSDGFPLLDLTHHGYTTESKLTAKGYTADDISKWKAADGTSLNFLFGGGNFTNSTGNADTQIAAADGTPYVKNYMNVQNTPLQVVNGKYQYFSYFNAADFNTREQKFYIRPYVERTETTGTSFITKDDYGDFLPFNHTAGQLVPNRSYNLYQEDVDYWFGMTMRTKFYMPKDGYTSQNEQMIFSFAGDDDVYLFIDDKLVLDIGGTHGSCTGFVNFQSGLVAAYYDFNGVTAGDKNPAGTAQDSKVADDYTSTDTYYRYYSTTIYEAYKAAMQDAGMSADAIEAELSSTFVAVMNADGSQATVKDYWGQSYPVYRFVNYSTHDLDYFYMERGSAVANCNIQFNLPTVSGSDLTIGKDLNYGTGITPSQDDQDFYDTAEQHSFQLLNARGEVPEGSKGYTYNMSTSDGQQAGTVTADSNGIFTIRADHNVAVPSSVLKEWMGTGSYSIRELIPVEKYQADGQVSVSGKVLAPGEAVTIGGASYIPYTFEVTVSEGTDVEAFFATYTNKRDLTTAGTLQIAKSTGNVYPGDDVTFPVQVTINGTPVPENTKFYELDASGNRVGDQVFAYADANGTISIVSGKTYEMGARLVAGYSYTVQELSPPEGWAWDSYTKKIGNGNPETLKDPNNQAANASIASGTITANTTDRITVVNKTAAINLEIPVSKQFVGMDSGDTKSRTASFTIKQVIPHAAGDGRFVDIGAQTPSVPATLAGISITCVGSSSNTRSISLAYDSGTANGDYYYQIQEQDVDVQPGEIFLKDPTVYVVKVTIQMSETDQSKQTAKVTAVYRSGELIAGTDNGVSIGASVSTLVFVNRRSGPELPETGGAGTLRYILSGGAFMALALMMYTITLCTRKSPSAPTSGPRQRTRRSRR